MGLFGGGGSSSTSSATDNRTVADAQARAIVGSKKVSVFETGSKAAQGNKAQYRESGSVDFSQGGILTEGGGFNFSGKNNKYLATGSADMSGQKVKAGGNVAYAYETDAGAVSSSYGFASNVLAAFLNQDKAAADEQAASIGSSVSDTISGALQGAADAITDASKPTDTEPWYQNKLLWVAGALAALLFFKGKRA